MRQKAAAAAAIFTLLIAAWVGLAYVGQVAFKPLGFRPISAQPAAGEAGIHSVEELYDALDALLDEVVVDGLVDYEAIANSDELERLGDAFARLGPRSTPELFTSEHRRLAYYINAYNVLTLLGVKRSLPIDSVQDVRGWVDLRAGFGFFFGYRFSLDGRRTSLHQLEQRLNPSGVQRAARACGDKLRVVELSCAARLGISRGVARRDARPGGPAMARTRRRFGLAPRGQRDRGQRDPDLVR